MRTLIVLAIGVAVSAGFVFVSRALGRAAVEGALAFIGAWRVFCAIDYTNGVKAGYSPVEELGIHIVVFTVPAVSAWLAARQLG